MRCYIFQFLLWLVMVAPSHVCFLNGLFFTVMTHWGRMFFFLEQLHNILLWQLQRVFSARLEGQPAQMHLGGCLPSRTTWTELNCPISVSGFKTSPLHFVSRSLSVSDTSLAFFRLLCFLFSFFLSFFFVSSASLKNKAEIISQTF